MFYTIMIKCLIKILSRNTCSDDKEREAALERGRQEGLADVCAAAGLVVGKSDSQVQNLSVMVTIRQH